MKRSILKYILLFCGVIPLLTSCESFLDKQETEDMTFEQIWQKRDYVRGYFQGAMSFLPNDLTGYVNAPTSAATDELINASTVSGELINTGSWNAVNVPGNTVGDLSMYNGIRECNIFMQNVYTCNDPTVTQEDKDDWYWCVRWARAYYYFLMMRNYGPVFLVGDEIINADATTESLYRPRNTWEQCVDYVTTEMTKCAEYFESQGKQSWNSDDEKGLPTAGAALAVISRLKLYSARDLFNGNTLYATVKNPVTTEFPDLSGVDLFPQTYSNEKWKEAVLAAQAVIDLGKYTLYRDASNDPYANYLGITEVDWNSELIWSTGYANRGIIARRTTPVGVKKIAGGNALAYGAIGPSQQQVDAYAMDNGKYPIIGYEADGSPVIDPTSNYPEDEFGVTKFANPFLVHLAQNPTAENDKITRDCRNMFVKREPRFYIAVYWSDSNWKYGPGATHYALCSMASGGNSNSSHDHSRGGYLVNRFAKHTVNFANNPTSYMVFPTFRLGEIYLNYIEAALEWEKRTGDTQYHAQAMKYWDDLRDRSGMESITDVYPGATIADLIEYCRKERRIELAFENHRYYDTRTWMIATDTDNGPIYGMNIEAKAASETDTPASFWQRTVVQHRVFRANHYLYPFAQRQIERNTLLTQNYGWK